MSRSMFRRYSSAAALSAVMLLGACNRPNGDATTAAPAAPAATPTEATPPASTELKVSKVVFGRYVEVKTFAVGGIGKTFKTSDQIFAAVQLEGSADTATVQVRLLDSAGQAVADQSRDVQPKKPMKLNFQMTKGLTTPLAAGTYRAETLLNGQSVMADEITVQ